MDFHSVRNVRMRTDCVRRCPRIVFFTARTRRSLSLSPSECIAPCSRDRSNDEAIVDDDVSMISSRLLEIMLLQIH